MEETWHSTGDCRPGCVRHQLEQGRSLSAATQFLSRFSSGAPVLAALVFLGTALLGVQNEAFAQDTVVYQFCVWDTAAEDGDRIHLDIDNRRILTSHELKNQEHCERVQVTFGRATNVTVTTTNDGNPPNTSAIRIRSNAGQLVTDDNGNEVTGDWQLCTPGNSDFVDCVGLSESQRWVLWPISEDTVSFSRVTDTDPTENPDEAEINAVEETLRAVTAGSLSNVTTNIGARFSSARSGGTALTLAGQPVFAGRDGRALTAMGRTAKTPTGTFVTDEASWDRAMSSEQLLQTSTFELSLNAAEDGSSGLGLAQWTLWGRGDVLVFDSDPRTGPRYDGDLQAGYLGLDAWIDDRWLVGVAASRTQVDADYRLDDGDGQLDVTLTSLHPYVRFAPDGRREFWAILGAGTGEVGNARAGASPRETTDVEIYMAAAGARQALEPTAGGVAIALLGDAGFGRLNGDAGSELQTLDNLAVDTWRARAGTEISYTMARDGGASITPFAEIAGRIDGGEDDTKAGVEVSAGVAYADPASGFGLEARGRTLVLYSGGDYQEYGASLTASLSPGAGGEGLSLALSPRLGTDPGKADVLWRQDPFGSLNTDRPEQALSLDAAIGYGMSVASGRGLATPFGELRVGNGESRRARAGVRFGLRGHANRVSLEFAGTWQEHRIDAPEHRLELIGRARF